MSEGLKAVCTFKVNDMDRAKWLEMWTKLQVRRRDIFFFLQFSLSAAISISSHALGETEEKWEVIYCRPI
jgi:hypothetical protein